MTGLIERLRAQATRRETPCGAGTMVWHVWGETRPGLPPVVLFHGGSGSWTHWVRNIQPAAPPAHRPRRRPEATPMRWWRRWLTA